MRAVLKKHGTPDLQRHCLSSCITFREWATPGVTGRFSGFKEHLMDENNHSFLFVYATRRLTVLARFNTFLRYMQNMLIGPSALPESSLSLPSSHVLG